MNKKGQSALEYLMTYGWALVVIVIVIAALFAFGIFNPPSAGTCTGLDKLAYSDHGYDATTQTFSISVKNGTGSVLTTFDGSIDAADMNSTPGGTWDLGDSQLFSLTGTAQTSPVAVVFTYTTASNIIHTETASCSFS
jgi:hypothetical protein